MCEQCGDESTPYEIEHGYNICMLCQLVSLLDLPTDFFTKEN